ncbi:sulfatase-like hydrolase/transferase [Tropicibacter sp. Alg240-R139]|uniref:sulfatase-like hydrolase/transferase n=1 Tax=Tropicibacter sp. Alg240-R139 TaxID=2305991 RepID=UPI0013E06A4D|nr:sulfatase-like hydrolase/transferase [Tropicibacter sp. Alg240-R139]
MTRPNFVFITADQHRGDCLGIEGRKIRTPHLDQLAREGARFTSAICPAPVCQPSRASILTGQLCRTNGVHDNGIDLDPEVGELGFAGALGAAGYQTAFFGKAHFSSYDARHKTGAPESVLSSEDYPDNWNGPYMGFQHIETLIHGHNYFTPQKPPRGQHFERFYYGSGRGDELNALYWKNGGDTKGAAQTWHSQLPLAYHNTPWTADRAIEWIKFKRDTDKPFVTWISFPDPHHPFDCPEPWSRLHDPADVDIPEHRTRDLENRPWWHKASIENDPQGDPESIRIRKEYSRIEEQTEEQLREIIANTYGQISLIDHHVGRIMNALREVNLDDNTYVIYSADHGDWLGDHGLILKGPMLYEGLLRVPLLVRGPSVPAGKVVSQPVSVMDLGPTMFDLTGVSPQCTQHGQSLRPLWQSDDARRDYAMCEWELLPNRVGVALSLRCVRTETDKLTMDMRSGAGEMYDLTQDPNEMINVFNEPAYAERRARLLTYLDQRPDDIGPVRRAVGPA